MDPWGTPEFMREEGETWSSKKREYPLFNK